jgi:hypothetical protein
MSEGFLDDIDEEEEDEPEVVESEVQEAQDENERKTHDVIKPDSNKSGIVRPVENVDEVVEMYDQFEDIKAKLLDKQKDLTDISGNPHVNKSGWRKIATAFNVSTSIKDKRSWTDENDIVHAEVEAIAVAPNGKQTSGMGRCSSNESNFTTKLSNSVRYDESEDSERIVRIDGKWRVIPTPMEVNSHNLMAIAETRAKNRAISDLVGGGEVSAEEMDAEFFLD